MRRDFRAIFIVALALASAIGAASSGVAAPPQDRSPDSAEWSRFVDALWPDAQAVGITRTTFDAAFAGLSLDPKVVAAAQHQPEYGKPVGDYVNAIASPERIKAGRAKDAAWAKTFEAIEKRYAIDRFTILGIWGIESDFGAEKDTYDVVRSLATLALVSDRGPYFRAELIRALEMIQDDAIGRKDMVGSWAGAMGQPQFMPSDYRHYAVNFAGSGRGDIWTSVPDSLASIANYLHQDGWDARLPWGFEVMAPAKFDYIHSHDSFAGWKKLGVKRADGKAMPSSGNAIMFFPTGYKGPAFLVTENFNVIKLYNNSDVYALAVCYLGDRIHGAGPIRAAWPKDDAQLSRDQRITLQKRLAALGYKVNDFLAHIDFDLRDSIRDVQKKLGMVPDGNPTPELLRRIDELKR